MFEKRNWKVFLLGLSFFLACGIMAFGQGGTDITGTVSDPSGAVIPSAKVTATNEGTNVSFSTTTTSAGVYRIANLNPGTYDVKAEAKGFKTGEQRGVELTVDVVNRTDFSLQLGQSVQTVTVEAGAQLVSTEEAKLQDTVRSSQIEDIALNGRNVFDLIKLAPGAVNVQGVMMENGAGTVVNGVRENYNGFLLDGMPNKGLSGGFVNQPNQDTVAEFTVNTLSMSAQYGSSAGSITNMVTKSGSNDFHGDVYEYLRNDALDASDFFSNKSGAKKVPLRFDQFGGSFGGPIVKDKTFFFASYQGDRTKTEVVAPVALESPQYENAVKAALPGSVAALLYSNFPTPAAAASGATTSLLVSDEASVYGTTADPSGFSTLVCPDNFSAFEGSTLAQAMGPSGAFQKLFGVTAGEAAGCPTPIAANAAPLGNRSIPLQLSTSSAFPIETLGNLFHGTEWSARIDDNVSETNRIFGRFNYQHTQDPYGTGNFTSLRGISSPTSGDFPSAVFSWTHIFSPTIVNEARGGYLRNSTNISVPKNQAGVPSISFGTGEIGFGAYNGYPQFFHEEIYSFDDLLSITHGKHSFKTGYNININQENSEFNVARPSYYFLDQLFFAADLPAEEDAGVDPGILTNKPAQLETNNRAWRNKEWGAFFQDDWKVSNHLTLNLGLRYDYFQRHYEKFGRATQFIYGSGTNLTTDVRLANAPVGSPGCTSPAQNTAEAQIAGVCGVGGFAPATQLSSPDRTDFSPRFGFAWDPKGNGQMAIRGGFGVSYEGSFYNALSNSRWNLPYYSFNIADNYLFGDVSNIVYGPQVGSPGSYVNCTTASPAPAGCSAPTYTGAATNPGQGIGAQAVGNLSGWDSSNANLAFLTGIVDPRGFRDPYVYNWFLGVQKQFNRSTGIEINYVGTSGHKLLRSENGNSNPGGRLPIPNTCASFYGSPAGANVCSNLSYSPAGRTNPNYGTLRIWENGVNSIYNSLQASLTRRLSNGLSLNANYTWGHSIDGGSDWHSGATSANGSAAGDAYNLDNAHPNLDRGNSTFDIRHRLVVSYVWQLPWYKSQNGFVGHVLGGWQTSGLWSFQTGAHWTAYSTKQRSLVCSGGTVAGISANTQGGAGLCMAGGGTVINNPNLSVGGDWNLDFVANDRPDVKTANTIAGTKQGFANGYFNGESAARAGFFQAPCLGCDGNLARNTFVGPKLFTSDLAMFKNIKINERFNALFRADFFNAFNRANFLLPSSSTGANFANRITTSIFGEAAGTFNPREIQMSLKLSF